MLQTKITDMLGLKHPLFQGGMAWVADAKLAAAVSNAGGLGLIGAAAAPADVVEQMILEAKSLTDKPFGVNVMLMSPYAAEVAQVCAKQRVAVVTTGAGNPGKYMDMWKEQDIKMIPVVASASLAKRMERAGRRLHSLVPPHNAYYPIFLQLGSSTSGHWERTFSDF